jgi:glycerol-3-phosphate dehydrogenase
MPAHQMVRDLRRLADTRFDLIIVGAGLYGAIAAWDATLRGLSVALIDQGDFGGGTSFNNLKTLHGGLRSLQSMNLTQMRLFIRERRALARVAPHLVQPLPFVVPTYRNHRRSALVMRTALLINELISRDRHEGLDDPSLHLAPGKVVDRDECLRLNPVIAPEGVTGGAVWHDYQMHSSDRMTFSFVLSAAARGADTANYVKAVGLVRSPSRVAAVTVEDQLTSNRFDIRGQTILNATGPWATSWLQDFAPGAQSPAPLLSRAMNLVVSRQPSSHACGGLANGRFLFLVPWRNVSMLGTSHDVHEGRPERLHVSTSDVKSFLDDATAAFPRAQLTHADLRLVHRGLLPMVAGEGVNVKLLRESTVVNHHRQGLAGLISMFGVRYTTARATAAQAIDAVFEDRGSPSPPVSRTAETPVEGGDINDKEAFLRQASEGGDTSVSADFRRRLALTYGTRYSQLLALMQEHDGWAQPLSATCAVTAAEIIYAIRHESAVRLSDALIRRTDAGSAGHPGDDAIRRASELMGHELRWSSERIAEEIDALTAFYVISDQ